jgi:hypothetical protein
MSGNNGHQWTYFLETCSLHRGVSMAFTCFHHQKHMFQEFLPSLWGWVQYGHEAIAGIIHEQQNHHHA